VSKKRGGSIHLLFIRLVSGETQRYVAMGGGCLHGIDLDSFPNKMGSRKEPNERVGYREGELGPKEVCGGVTPPTPPPPPKKPPTKEGVLEVKFLEVTEGSAPPPFVLHEPYTAEKRWNCQKYTG